MSNRCYPELKKPAQLRLFLLDYVPMQQAYQQDVVMNCVDAGNGHTSVPNMGWAAVQFWEAFATPMNAPDTGECNPTALIDYYVRLK